MPLFPRPWFWPQDCLLGLATRSFGERVTSSIFSLRRSSTKTSQALAIRPKWITMADIAAIVLKSLAVISFLSKKCEGAIPTLFQWIDWIRQKSFHSQTKYRPFHRSACDGTRRREGRHKKRPWGGSWLRPPFAMKKKKSLFPPPSFSYVFGTGKTGLTNEKKILSKSHNSILNHYREMDGLECRLN